MANGLKQTLMGAASSNEMLSGTYKDDVQSNEALTNLSRPTLEASSATARQYCWNVPYLTPKADWKVLDVLYGLALMPSRYRV